MITLNAWTVYGEVQKWSHVESNAQTACNEIQKWSSVVVQSDELLPAMPHGHTSVCDSSLIQVSSQWDECADSSLISEPLIPIKIPANDAGKSVGHDPCIWVSSTFVGVGDPDGNLNSWFCPRRVMVIVVIWGISLQLGDSFLSRCLFNYTFQINEIV